MKNEPDELLPARWTLIDTLKNWDDQESWRQRGVVPSGPVEQLLRFDTYSVYVYEQFL